MHCRCLLFLKLCYLIFLKLVLGYIASNSLIFCLSDFLSVFVDLYVTVSICLLLVSLFVNYFALINRFPLFAIHNKLGDFDMSNFYTKDSLRIGQEIIDAQYKFWETFPFTSKRMWNFFFLVFSHLYLVSLKLWIPV